MRHVLSTDEVAHAWAHQTQGDARNKQVNFYFEGPAIYSYGSHFPIAQHVEGKDGQKAILFTEDTYSNTTSKHIHLVRSAIPHDAKVLSVPTLKSKWYQTDESMRQDYLDRYKEQARDWIESAAKPRIRATTRLKRLGEAQECNRKARELAEFFGLEFEPVPMPTDEELESIRKRAAEIEQARIEEDRRRAEARELLAKKREEKAQEDLKEWMSGGPKTDRMSYLSLHYGRIKPGIGGQTVETTGSVEIPVDQAVKFTRAMLWLYKQADEGKIELPAARYEHTSLFDRIIVTSANVGSFSLEMIDSSGVARIGCHRFERSEIERWAVVLGIGMEDLPSSVSIST